MKLSQSDRRLLGAIQLDATRSQAELADVAGVSRTSVWRRIRDFEESGVLTRQVALVDPKAAGLNIHVLLSVALTEHTDANRQEFERRVAMLPEVTECFSVSGERDYMLQVSVQDMESYNAFLNEKILKLSAVRSASSTFVLRRVKYTTQLPVLG
ncbi:MAG: Lrp/AsnC family transcriptional regulator [Gammaproteobacteria bacterium]